MKKNKTNGLLTDLYQITMAYGYWKLGLDRQRAVFHSFFRRQPFRGGYSVFSGLWPFVDFTRNFGFTEQDLDYLSKLTGSDEKPLFEDEFLACLAQMEFSCDIDAVAEGTVVFPHEPLVRISGPLIQCQILETPLLNFTNFQSLIATKAARICSVAGNDPVLEFGLRRAHGMDGALSASRAAYVGGCAATSNVLAGKLYNIPVRGTIAHSWVMAFDDELSAFRAYAKTLPNNSILLVDTYDTLEGVRRSITVGKELAAKGHVFSGIRIDSGDLCALAKQARSLLDESGFKKTKIVASNDLDEYRIRDLKKNNTPIDIWGVGTRLVTAYDHPALDGVYKLTALDRKDGTRKQVLKLSEQPEKTTIPGIQQIRRFRRQGKYLGDMIYDTDTGVNGRELCLLSGTRKKEMLPPDADYCDLLVPVVRSGKAVGPSPALKVIRKKLNEELRALDSGIFALANPLVYPVGLEKTLWQKRQEHIAGLKKNGKTG